MENASRALIIAGSVLISLVVISSLIWMFQSIKSWQKVEATSEEEQKMLEYNKQIETYNRAGLYGSEIMSLANLIQDYNKRQADLKGYQPIALKITIKQITGAKYMTQTEYSNYENLINQFEKLDKQVSTKRDKIIYAGKSAQKISSMRDVELIALIKEKEGNHLSEEQIEGKVEQLKNEANEYSNLKSELMQFKNKLFKVPTVVYDQYNGRVKSMTFVEVGF